MLDKPRVLFSEPGGGAQVLFYGVLLALGCTGGLGLLLLGPSRCRWRRCPLLGVGAVCLAFSLFLFLTKKPSWLASLVGIALWVGAVWYFFEDLVQGCAHTVNLVLEAYGNRLGVLMPQMATDPALTQGQIQQQCTVFCCLLTFPYLFFLGWALAGHKSAFGAFCLTGLPLCVPMLISLVPPAPYVAALLLFWAVLLLFSPSFGKRHRLLEDHGRYHAAGNALARPAMLLLFLSGAALCMAFTLWLVPYSTYQRPQIAADLRDGFTNGFGLEASLRGGVGSGNSRVDLSALGSRHYTGETALRVKYDWEWDRDQSTAQNLEKDYLKSFVGSVYTGHSWERLDSAAARELEAAAGELEVQSLLVRYQELGGSQNRYASDHLLHPVCGERGGPAPAWPFSPTAPWAGPVGGAGPGPGGGRLRPVLPVAAGHRPLPALLPGPAPGVLLLRAGPSPCRWTCTPPTAPPRAGRSRKTSPPRRTWPPPWSLSDALRGDPAAQPQAWTETGQFLPDRWRIPGWALAAYEAYDPEAAAFLQSVEAYSDFVYRYYTQLPAGLEDFLNQFRLEHGLDPTGYSDPIAAMEEGLHRLYDQGYTYTLSPPEPAGGGGLRHLVPHRGPGGLLRPLRHRGGGLVPLGGHPRPVRRGLRRTFRGGRMGGCTGLQRPRLGGNLSQRQWLGPCGGHSRRSRSPCCHRGCPPHGNPGGDSNSLTHAFSHTVPHPIGGPGYLPLSQRHAGEFRFSRAGRQLLSQIRGETSLGLDYLWRHPGWTASACRGGTGSQAGHASAESPPARPQQSQSKGTAAV